MECTVKLLALFSLGIGLISVGTLSLAVSTDYWLYTMESVPCTDPACFMMEMETENGTVVVMASEDANVEPFIINIHCHSGLWRICIFYPDLEDEVVPATCDSIGYFNQPWDRIKEAEVTLNVLRAIRKSAPFIVLSLVLVIAAFSVTTVGNAKHDVKTLIGAILYIFSADKVSHNALGSTNIADIKTRLFTFLVSALLLAFGTILYIAAVNDETAHKKKPAGDSGAGFTYGYRWAFFCAGTSFIASKITAVINISLYLRRYEKVEDITAIIPGLENRVDSDVTKEEDGSLNPTIIL